MIKLITNAICAAIVVATVALFGGPKWGAIGFGAIVFLLWTAYDLICDKLDIIISKQK